MRSVGIFEAKAKLSEICDEVARTRESIVVTRRGRPLVRIEPAAADTRSVWEDRAEYIVRRGKMREEFELPERSREVPTSPLDE